MGAAVNTASQLSALAEIPPAYTQRPFAKSLMHLKPAHQQQQLPLPGRLGETAPTPLRVCFGYRGPHFETKLPCTSYCLKELSQRRPRFFAGAIGIVSESARRLTCLLELRRTPPPSLRQALLASDSHAQGLGFPLLTWANFRTLVRKIMDVSTQVTKDAEQP